MARFPPGPANSGAEQHGLRFMNEDWNESISNGQPFTLRWNESLDGIAAELGVFTVAYPQEGLVVYELVSNLTTSISAAHYEWTPENLADELYALWITTKSDTGPNWAISPPWRPKDIDSHNFEWAAPIGIPIVVILSLYALGVCTCLMYRRRKKKERAALRESQQSGAAGRHSLVDRHRSVDRHPSVDSEATAHTLSDPEAVPKHEPWPFVDSSRRPSDTSSTGLIDRASEETIVESQWLHCHVNIQPGPSRMGVTRDPYKQTRKAKKETRRPESW